MIILIQKFPTNSLSRTRRRLSTLYVLIQVQHVPRAQQQTLQHTLAEADVLLAAVLRLCFGIQPHPCSCRTQPVSICWVIPEFFYPTVLLLRSSVRCCFLSSSRSSIPFSFLLFLLASPVRFQGGMTYKLVDRVTYSLQLPCWRGTKSKPMRAGQAEEDRSIHPSLPLTNSLSHCDISSLIVCPFKLLIHF